MVPAPRFKSNYLMAATALTGNIGPHIRRWIKLEAEVKLPLEGFCFSTGSINLERIGAAYVATNRNSLRIRGPVF